MSVLSVKNLQEVFVAKDIARTASAQITDPTATGYIADGEVVVLNSTGAVYNSATMSYTTSPWIQIAQRNGDNVIISNKIYGNKLFTYTGVNNASLAQGAEQITHIGFNGTAGSFDVSGLNDFYLTLTPNQDDMQWSEQKQKNVTLVTKALVGTSQAILAEQIVINVMKKYMTDGIPVTAVMLNSSTTTAPIAGAATAKVVHGSPTVTYSGVHGLAAGNMVRLGVTGSGVTANVPVYIVKEVVSTTVVTLSSPYAGPNQAAIPNADHALVTAGANYGVRFTGKALPFTLDFFKFKRTNFTVQMKGFGITPLSKTQNTSYGQGDGRLAAEEESFCKGFQGALNRMTVPLPTLAMATNYGSTPAAVNTTYADQFINASQLYETIQISFYGENIHTTTPSVKMPETIKIFGIYNAGGNQITAANTGIVTALNDWMASTPNAFANLTGF